MVLGFRDIVRSNGESNGTMENEMETGSMQGFKGLILKKSCMTLTYYSTIIPKVLGA